MPRSQQSSSEPSLQNPSELPAATAAIRPLLLTGMRVGEVTGLRWKDIDRERVCLVLADTKTGAQNKDGHTGLSPLSTQATSEIQPLSPGSRDDLVLQVFRRPNADAQSPLPTLGIGSDTRLALRTAGAAARTL